MSARESSSMTRLQRDLAGDQAPRRPTAIDAFELAREAFLAGRRVDMNSLSGELGINRATLYRWTGSRGQLLVEVLWDVTASTLEAADQQAKEAGAERVVQVATRLVEATLADEGFRRFVVEEPFQAVRLLAGASAGYEPRLVAAFEQMLREESEGGRLDASLDPHTVGFAIVRVAGGFTYPALITDQQADIPMLQAILRQLLRAVR